MDASVSLEKLNELRAAYPNAQAGLSAEEVAMILRRKSTRGVVQKIREGFANGRYKGARKVDGQWRLPLEDLAEIIEPTPQTTGAPVGVKATTGRVGRRKSELGPMIEFIRSMRMWALVLDQMGLISDGDQLRGDADRARWDLINEENARRAERERSVLSRAVEGQGRDKDRGPL